jgi:hypothetical protein
MIDNFAKILEKIMKGRLIKFLENNNLLSKEQCDLDLVWELKVPCTVLVNLYTTH